MFINVIIVAQASCLFRYSTKKNRQDACATSVILLILLKKNQPMKDTTIQNILKRHQLKKTATRTKILELYINHDHALSHKEIEDILSDKHDRVTIYRTLNSFEEKGIIHKVHDNNPSVRYALCGNDCGHQHHQDDHIHFNCTACNKTFCIESVLLPTISIPTSFHTESIHFFAKGLCKNCKK